MGRHGDALRELREPTRSLRHAIEEPCAGFVLTPADARALLANLLGRIAPEVDLDQIDPEAALQEAAELDSMDFVNLVTALHEATGIDVPERDYPRLATVDGFVAYVAAA